MSDWLEHSAQVEVAVPIDQVWNLWSDLEQIPQCMKWIDSVKIQADDPALSRWKLASGAFEFTWLSRVTNEITHQIIQWESVDGLPNQGAIRFYDRKAAGSVVRLSVSYKIPLGLGGLMDNLFVGNIVESTLQKDLECFRDYAQAHTADL